MNNKGQTLVVFVLILPVLLFIFTLVIDIGFVSISKRNINNNLYDASKYYLNNIEDIEVESKTKKLLNKNIKDIDEIIIEDKGSYISINLKKDIKGIYSFVSNIEIDLTYKVIKESKEIIKG